MALPARYKRQLVIGWGVLGAAMFVAGGRYIGGVAIFFLLSALALWTVFPLIHLGVASLIARKFGGDPTPFLWGIMLVGVAVVLGGALASGAFNFV